MDYNEERILLQNLSKNARQIIKSQHVTLKELVQRTGLSIHVIRNMKDGKVKKLNALNIYKLASGLQVTPKILLGVENIPEEMQIKEEHLEFVSSFYEKDGGDFEFYEKCELNRKYDDEYEACVVNSIHSFVEAHKLATGYYFEGIDRVVTQQLTKKSIEDKYEDYVIEKILKRYEGNEDVNDNSTWNLDKAKATGEAIQKMRNLYKMSRKELADKTGLGEDCLYRIETGKNKKVNYEHIYLIARELFCTADFLMGESCDPTANQNGQAQFYFRNELIFRHVQIGHDLAYAKNYMDQESKSILINMMRSLDLMYEYRVANEILKGKRLSIQDVYFREQQIYMDTHKTRGAHFYTKKYTIENQ